jgi:hypothetical protein
LAEVGLFCQNEGSEALIPVAMKPEPPDFATKVRARGAAFLRHTPCPKEKQFRKNSYWKECLPQLYAAYSGICAYSAFWLPMERSLDHFIPKSSRPDLAYEWSNYRLASPRVNGHKANNTDVLDPFSIPQGWFVLNFANFWVEPSGGLEARVDAKVRRTIEVLKLNIDDVLVSLRFKVVQSYAKGHSSFDYLAEYYPFIAQELSRQNQKETIKALFQ